MSNEKVRAELVEELASLVARTGVIEAHLRNADREMPADWSERGAFLENDEVLEALDDQGRRRLAQLRDALARIDSGKWGTCTDCGKEINPRRLAALPEASTCVSCASAA